MENYILKYWWWREEEKQKKNEGWTRRIKFFLFKKRNVLNTSLVSKIYCGKSCDAWVKIYIRKLEMYNVGMSGKCVAVLQMKIDFHLLFSFPFFSFSFFSMLINDATFSSRRMGLWQACSMNEKGRNLLFFDKLRP